MVFVMGASLVAGRPWVDDLPGKVRAVQAAGIVLAGGRSSRMGRSKAALEWHGSTLLRRAVGIMLRSVDGPVLVVRAPGQELPALPAGVPVAEDPVEGRGPLQGITAGLAAVAGQVPVAFVRSVDLPFLHPAYVRRVLDADVLLPVAHGHHQPLAAAYRASVATVAAGLFAEGRSRPPDLFATVDVHRAEAAELLADPVLATLDPDLDSLVNVNTPTELADAAASAAPEIVVDGRRGPGGDAGRGGPGPVRPERDDCDQRPRDPLVTGDALVEIDTSVVRTMIEPV
jgi:molybdopterin-guanine dinucleotide biosynthesis protein A